MYGLRKSFGLVEGVSIQRFTIAHKRIFSSHGAIGIGIRVLKNCADRCLTVYYFYIGTRVKSRGFGGILAVRQYRFINSKA